MSAFNSERPVTTVMVQYLRFVTTAHYLHCLETCGNFSISFFFFFVCGGVLFLQMYGGAA